MKFSKLIFLVSMLVTAALLPVSSPAQEAEAEHARQAAMEAAESARAEAAQVHEVAKVHQLEAEEMNKEQAEVLERAREEMRTARDQLRQAQAEMREASQAVAMAQRKALQGRNFAVRTIGSPQVIDFQNRAIIGVIMGEVSNENGVAVIGLTPGGPAEAAGLEKGDIIIGINGRLFANEEETGTDIIKDEVSGLTPGDKVELLYQRDGENNSVLITTQSREPLTVHSMIRIPEAPFISEQVLRVIEQVEVPDVDVEIIEKKLAQIEEKLGDGNWSFGGPHYNVQFAPGTEFSYEAFSDLANSAIDNTMVWFSGSQYVSGLQFAAMNDDLGVYFDTPEGVLVLNAREDNSLNLRSGDVILEINGNAVKQPADVMRELRFVEDNAEAELLVMRNRNLESFVVTLPENKIQEFEIHVAPEADH